MSIAHAAAWQNGEDHRETGENDSGLIICCPVYNDWDSALQLLDEIGRVVGEADIKADILFIDDYSRGQVPQALNREVAGIGKVEILRLRRNLGHQRAIVIGLTFIALNRPCSAVVVMDSDGEDAPDDIPRLVRRYEEKGGGYAVFAQRTRRSESLKFRIFYRFYKTLYRILTGRVVEVGNFSIMPMHCLQSLVTVSTMWNHYAASVYQSSIPVTTIPSERRTRFAGRSKMNFTSLVAHGLSAIAVYSETVGVRLCIFSFILSMLVAGCAGAVVFIRMFTALAIPGWATTAVGALSIIFLQLMGLSVVFILFTLQGRNNLTFLPIRDFSHFIASIDELKCGD